MIAVRCGHTLYRKKVEGALAEVEGKLPRELWDVLALLDATITVVGADPVPGAHASFQPPGEITISMAAVGLVFNRLTEILGHEVLHLLNFHVDPQSFDTPRHEEFIRKYAAELGLGASRRVIRDDY